MPIHSIFVPLNCLNMTRSPTPTLFASGPTASTFPTFILSLASSGRRRPDSVFSGAFSIAKSTISPIGSIPTPTKFISNLCYSEFLVYFKLNEFDIWRWRRNCPLLFFFGAGVPLLEPLDSGR